MNFTRLFSVLLIAPLVVEYLRQVGWRLRRIRSDVLRLALVPLGVADYSLYCLVELGSPVQFSIAQRQWGRRYTFPGEAGGVGAVRAAAGVVGDGAGAPGAADHRPGRPAEPRPPDPSGPRPGRG
ncbi:hypothetical protein [Actinoplanes sp. NPDC049599]|uniref:hypothetical protein n=1 Tax=Actinoplanes sp. NPDC049599 TaxID=3363903 RepID=UPI0037B9BFEF